MDKPKKKPAADIDNVDEGGTSRPRGFNPWVLAIAIGAMLLLFFATRSPFRSEISYQLFEKYRELNQIAEVTIVGGTYAEGRFRLDKDGNAPARLELVKKGDKYQWQEKKDKDGKIVRLNKEFGTKLPPDIKELQAELKAQGDRGEIQYGYKADADNALMLYYAIMFLVPIGLFAFMWIMLRRSREQMMGGGFLSGFTKSPARKFSPDNKQTTFADVAGLDSVKADLQEIIEFLKEPAKFQRLGGQVPKGVLLLGPPGTGKTLLARAVAGEAGVPFFSANGSEFIQMFVGVGAGRVRDLFQTAKKSAPAIIFIDEIDAVGRQRGAGLGGGHDEREQTLNQILGEMDGFNQGETVIVIAATNRPDVLDPALLRPGRFDRHVTVDRPTKKGREAIFKVHVREVPLADDVDLSKLAAGTVGMTGADIKNIVNEAALWAARQNKSKVFMEDFDYARDKVLMGPRREDALIGEEKRRTAYHEAGHALIAWLLDGIDRLHKVTVIPRGRSLGVTETVPEEDKMNISEHELHNRLSFFLGGREAERLVYDQCSAGAENDLERATKLTRRMVTQWGMSKRLGPVSYKMSSEDPFLGREMHSQRQFSESTLQIIDEEVARILHTASEQALRILSDNRDKLDAMAAALVEREELGESEITELIGPSIHRRREEAEKTAEEFEEHTNGSAKSSASASAGATRAASEHGQETA